MNEGGAGPCCVDVFQSTRKPEAQTAHLHALPRKIMQLSRAVRVQLYAVRRRAERPGRPMSCRQVRLMQERQLVRACAECVYVSLQ
eukprot:COSAG02_NODE_2108_length_9809_cov_4.022966_5_plen_86_part_00